MEEAAAADWVLVGHGRSRGEACCRGSLRAGTRQRLGEAREADDCEDASHDACEDASHDACEDASHDACEDASHGASDAVAAEALQRLESNGVEVLGKRLLLRAVTAPGGAGADRGGLFEALAAAELATELQCTVPQAEGRRLDAINSTVLGQRAHRTQRRVARSMVMTYNAMSSVAQREADERVQAFYFPQHPAQAAPKPIAVRRFHLLDTGPQGQPISHDFLAQRIDAVAAEHRLSRASAAEAVVKGWGRPVDSVMRVAQMLGSSRRSSALAAQITYVNLSATKVELVATHSAPQVRWLDEGILEHCAADADRDLVVIEPGRAGWTVRHVPAPEPPSQNTPLFIGFLDQLQGGPARWVAFLGVEPPTSVRAPE